MSIDSLTLFVCVLSLQILQPSQSGDPTNVSFNLPKFCSNPVWNPTPTRYPNSDTKVENAYGIFVTRNDTVYVASQKQCTIHVFSGNTNTSFQPNPDDCGNPSSIFITHDNTIYIASDNERKSVRCSQPSGCLSIGVPKTKSCAGLFVSSDQRLYCSVKGDNQIIKVPVTALDNEPEVVAGTFQSGSTQDALSAPHGIFVHVNLTLYVADHGNHRIQRFPPNNLTGTTVAGMDTSEPIDIHKPIAVILDANDYLYIVGEGKAQIFIQGPNGWRCLGAGTQLTEPRGLAFDSSGNLIVTSKGGGEVIKFQLVTNSCNAENSQGLTIPVNLPSTDQSSCVSVNPVDQPATLTPLRTTDVAERSSILSSYPATNTNSVPLISSPDSFVPSACSNDSGQDAICAMIRSPCSMLEPCKSDEICRDHPGATNGFRCEFREELSSNHSDDHDRICEENICWNKGICHRMTRRMFNCTCEEHWQGHLCETKINYCRSVTCLNGGVCRPSIGNWTCECPTKDYFGRHCELTTSRIVTYRLVARSFAYIAIVAMSLVAMFIVMMDILKYCFGVDLTDEDRKKKSIKDLLRARKKKSTV